MPYISCPRCGVTTYCVTQEECPLCGTLLDAGGVAHGPLPRTQSTGPIGRALRMAREQIGIDAALLTEVRDDQEVVRHVVQDGAFPDLAAGLAAPLQDTICRRLLEGRIPNLVADVGADPELRDLPAVAEYGVGAYLGVHLTAADARLYLLCCLAREVRPDLGDDDVRALRLVARRLRGTLDAGTAVPFARA
jgi:GAF domain-containing protein